MRALIKECIEKLQYFSELDIRTAKHFKLRAKVVAECLKLHFDEGNLESCATIIEIEFRNSRQNCGAYWFQVDTPVPSPDVNDYGRIIQEAKERLDAINYQKEPAGGEKIIHRVWLGKNLEGSQIQKILACNQYFREIWKTKIGSKKVPLKTILWTNCKALLAVNSRFPGVEIRDYSELTKLDRCLSQYIESFIQHGDYAFASDLLRLLAVFFYGGLYLSINWSQDAIFCRGKRRRAISFEPTQETLKFFTNEVGGFGFVVQFPFGITSNGELINQSFNVSFDPVVDTELFYIGMKYSPFIKYLLEVISHFFRFQDTVNKKGKIVANYRLYKERVVKRSRLEDIAELEKQIHLKLDLNVGAVMTNSYPLMVTFAHMGMTRRYIVFNELSSLRKEYGFRAEGGVGALKNLIYIESLRLMRPVSQSWKKIPINYRVSREI